MIFLTAALAAALVVTIILFLRHISQLERAWTDERRELVNRVQAPDRIPLPQHHDFVMPEAELDDWNRVGEIDLSENTDG